MLLDCLNLDKVELSGLLEFEDIVSGKYRTLVRGEAILTCLGKGEENIQIKHEPERLKVEDA